MDRSMCSPSKTDAGILSSSSSHIAASELSLAMHAGKSSELGP